MVTERRHAWIILLFILLLALFVLYKTGTSCNESFLPSQKNTIFVSIASYRDKACLNTVKHLYDQADDPKRVFIGICEQNTSDAAESCVPASFPYHDNIRRITISNKEAKGPTYARYLCSTLYGGEAYFMQIDSHTLFAKGWDTKAIKLLNACPDSPTAIITAYPHDSKTYTLEEKSIPVLCDASFSTHGIPNFKAQIMTAEKAQQKANIPVPFIAGGFIFGAGTLVKDVPYDPGLSMLFNGEEILLAARLWTSGYNFFAPKENIVLHAYYRHGEAKFHEDIPTWGQENKASLDRAKRLLGLLEPVIPAGSEPYALGTKRTIQAYWSFAGIDPVQKTVNSKAKFC